MSIDDNINTLLKASSELSKRFFEYLQKQEDLLNQKEKDILERQKLQMERDEAERKERAEIEKARKELTKSYTEFYKAESEKLTKALEREYERANKQHPPMEQQKTQEEEEQELIESTMEDIESIVKDDVDRFYQIGLGKARPRKECPVYHSIRYVLMLKEFEGMEDSLPDSVLKELNRSKKFFESLRPDKIAEFSSFFYEQKADFVDKLREVCQKQWPDYIQDDLSYKFTPKKLEAIYRHLELYEGEYYPEDIHKFFRLDPEKLAPLVERSNRVLLGRNKVESIIEGYSNARCSQEFSGYKAVSEKVMNMLTFFYLEPLGLEEGDDALPVFFEKLETQEQKEGLNHLLYVVSWGKIDLYTLGLLQ